MKGFTVAVDLTSAVPKKDKSVKISFVTSRELPPEEQLEIFKYLYMSGSGWLLFSPNEISESDIPKDMAEKGAKTPSQRLRAVLFILWKQVGDIDDFEKFYQIQMETFINEIKFKLDKE